MIVAVTGSRNWNAPQLLKAVLSSQRIGHLHVGCARGADLMAIEWAKAWPVGHTRHVANWDEEDKAAGMLRNRRMLDEGKPRLLIAFRRGRSSKGTDGCIKEARARNIPVLLVEIP